MLTLSRTRTLCALLLLILGLPALSGCTAPNPTGPAAAQSAATPTLAAPAATATPADDLAGLSDEFDNAATLPNWQDHATVEGWPSRIARLDINTTSAGQLYLAPTTSTWFEDYHGVYLFKTVTGDFDATTRVQATGKSTLVPQRTFSLAGLMARAPRSVTPQTWTPGHENWVFITTGYGDEAPGRAGKPQIETKTTTNSRSVLQLIRAASGWVDLRIVRLGPTFMMLYRLEGGEWKISQRYTRPDMPATVQVGLNAYSNWASVGPDAATFNSTVVPKEIAPADLVVHSDYVRFHRPHVPAAMQAQVATGDLRNDAWLQLIGP